MDKIDEKIEKLETLLDAEKRRQYEADRIWRLLMALLSQRSAAKAYIRALEQQLNATSGQILPPQKERYDHSETWLEGRAKSDHIKL